MLFSEIEAAVNDLQTRMITEIKKQRTAKATISQSQAVLKEMQSQYDLIWAELDALRDSGDQISIALALKRDKIVSELGGVKTIADDFVTAIAPVRM